MKTYEWALTPGDERTQAYRRLFMAIREMSANGKTVRVTAWNPAPSENEEGGTDDRNHDHTDQG